MSVPAAFIGVVLVWSTTPLAIKWSSEGAGFLFGVASRMVLGLFVCLVLIALMSRRMRWGRDALLTYLAGGLGIWGAMTCVYWGAQHLPSGLVSVLFGFSPVVTALFAAVWLQEPALTPFRLFGMGLGIAGLVLIFGQGTALGDQSLWGMAAVLLSVHIHAFSAVWIKRIGARLHPLETATGSLLVAVPLFLLDWAVGDGCLPAELPSRTLWAIVYLAVFGSALGFVLYYHVLHHVQASRVALITLMTPVIALLLGQGLNGETVNLREWLGTATILAGLASFQWGERWYRRVRAPAGQDTG